MDVVEGVAAACGFGFVWGPGGVEGEEAQQSGGDEGGLGEVLGFELGDDGCHEGVPELAGGLVDGVVPGLAIAPALSVGGEPGFEEVVEVGFGEVVEPDGMDV